MNEQQRTALRVANLIRDALVAQEGRRLGAAVSDDRGLSSAMNRYLDLCRKVAKAHSHKWLDAARTLSTQATAALEDLHYEIEAHRRGRHDDSQPVSSLGELVRELGQIAEEFHEWDFDDEALTLSVRTDDIELEGIQLGPFNIQLHLRELGRSDPTSAYCVVAQEPNGAGGRDTVTHPHVSEDRLCAGDAMAPIRAALQTGRLCDFFILVRSVLQTYNPSSAYVRLEEWSGQPCHDCGHLLDEDEGFFCEYCENNFCDSCTSYCRQCDTSACLQCLETCSHCDQRTCTDCMKTCDECGHACCAGCLTDGLCPTCQEEKENNDECDEHQDGSDDRSEDGTEHATETEAVPAPATAA